MKFQYLFYRVCLPFVPLDLWDDKTLNDMDKLLRKYIYNNESKQEFTPIQEVV